MCSFCKRCYVEIIAGKKNVENKLFINDENYMKNIVFIIFLLERRCMDSENEIKLDLFKINETLTYRFYQMPKELFRNPLYKGKLSLEAKVTYTLLLDRLELSRLNKWFNENGEIYLIYTRQELINELKISRTTASKVFSELKKCNLIKEERLGQGMANRIYIGKMQSENLEKFKERTFRSPKEELLEVQNRISRSLKENSNNTNINNTELNIYNSQEKIFFADKVSLKMEELNNLVEQYGNEKTAKIIVALDLYKKSSGKVYASDYNAILNWVINKVERDEKRELEGSSKRNNNRYKSYTQREYDDLESFYDIGGIN